MHKEFDLNVANTHFNNKSNETKLSGKTFAVRS